MSLFGTFGPLRWMEAHCQKPNTTSSGGKIKAIRLLGMNMILNVMTSNPISIIGV